MVLFHEQLMQQFLCSTMCIFVDLYIKKKQWTAYKIKLQYNMNLRFCNLHLPLMRCIVTLPEALYSWEKPIATLVRMIM